jgi:Interferon-induced transmembrane protein/zinc-ribbon domain
MYCTNCGQPRPDGAVACPNCNAPIRTPNALPGAPVAIPNYLVQSVLVTLCCCLPLGVVAIVNSAQVDSRIAAGDIAGAQRASKNAKLFAWLGVAGGIVSGFAYAALQFLGYAHS